MPNDWKGHLYVSLSEVCFENARGLLINDRSNFRDERIIVRKIATTFRKERIIVRKFTVNHRAIRIIVRKIARIKTIGVTKMRGNIVEISFQAKFLRKATKSQEFRRNSFALLLHNTVSIGIIDFPGFDTSWFYCGVFIKCFIIVFTAHAGQIIKTASRKQRYCSSI